MKPTGIIIMLIGVAGILFSVIAGMPTNEVGTAGVATEASRFPVVPLVMGFAAIIGGFLIFVYGGRGYHVTPKTPSSA